MAKKKRKQVIARVIAGVVVASMIFTYIAELFA